jgi:threonine synthase
MDSQLLANRNGHIACTQGGECLAGLVKALKKNIVTKKETAILDATAHAIKFSEFQDLYFNSKIPEDYKIDSDLSNINQPFLILPDDPTIIPSQKKRLGEIDFQKFIKDISGKIAKKLDLTTPL